MISCGTRSLLAHASGALFAMVLLAGCSTSPYHDPPRYKLPKDRTAAARQLISALAFGGAGYQDVGGTEVVLRWREQRDVTNKQRMWIDRELDLRKLGSISEPYRPGELWQVRVVAPGGIVTFEFHESDSAAQAASALLALAQRDAG